MNSISRYYRLKHPWRIADVLQKTFDKCFVQNRSIYMIMHDVSGLYSSVLQRRYGVNLFDGCGDDLCNCAQVTVSASTAAAAAENCHLSFTLHVTCSHAFVVVIIFTSALGIISSEAKFVFFERIATTVIVYSTETCRYQFNDHERHRVDSSFKCC
jgi:hypothetical protein